MIRTQVYLDDAAYVQARVLARQVNVPAASLIRNYVNAGIKADLKKRGSARDALLKLAKHAVRGGPRDLAINHDDYLYGDK